MFYPAWTISGSPDDRERAMMRFRFRVDQPDGQAKTLELVSACIRMGRDEACEIGFTPIDFPMVSSVHARIESSANGIVLTHLSRNNKTLVNDSAVEGSVTVRVGDRIRLGATGPTVAILTIESTVLPASTATPRFDQTVQADTRHLALLRGTARTERFDLGNGGLIGREAGAVRFHLDHPHVSRQHASLTVDGQRIMLADLGSSNGTFVNGQQLTRPTALNPGDRVDIGPFSLRFDGAGLISRSRSNYIELVARGLKRVVADRATGQPIKLLDHISLVIRPKEFVCLLAPSGSGKSTLLAILSGRNPPNTGRVALNGEDLYAHFEALKEDIAVVPQKDVLHDTLAVRKALRYTAELRLPQDLSRDEIEASVTDILDVVGLTNRRDMLIRHLSGGQMKRASLANELVARPSLLFLDEVTSGLDEQTDREVMELFRQVADGGKTVVCITHNLANVEATCHLVVILTEGGRLAFIGTPDEAKAYFEITRLGDVYRKLAEEQPEMWHHQFRSSPYFHRYVVERMPSATMDEEKETAPTPHFRHEVSVFRQAWILTRRYVSIWRGDWQAVLAMLGQSLSVAFLLGLVFGNLDDVTDPVKRVQRTVNLLLLLSVSCFWFGCNTAAKELVKEREIFIRERDIILRVAGYFTSKFLVLALIGVVQATLLYVIVRVWCEPPGSAVFQWAELAALAVAGTAIGLFISAMARSEEVATALVPIAVIPQIVLAGVVAPLDGLALWMAKGLVTVYWSREALERLFPEFELRLLGRHQEGFSGPLVMVLAHAAVCTAATVVVLRQTTGKTGLR
jgi:ABC transport system ATP-binding/permease protein